MVCECLFYEVRVECVGNELAILMLERFGSTRKHAYDRLFT